MHARLKLFHSYIFLLSLWSLILGLLIFFHIRGIIYYDEGYILNAALRIAHGQVPYKDFDIIYTPLSFLITAGFFKLFGESLLVSRIVALLISVASSVILYKLLGLLTKNKAVILVSLLFFIAWGPAHINFSAPTMFALCLSLYTAYFYQKGVIKWGKGYFYCAGLMACLVFFAKQNFGTGIVLSAFLLSFFVKKSQRQSYILFLSLGTLTICAVAFIYFVSTASLYSFFHNIYYYTFEKIILGKINDTPFLYDTSFLRKIAKLTFYLSPLVFSLVAFLGTFKQKKKTYGVILFVLVFYLMGIRPTTDYDHFVPLLAFGVLPLVILFEQIEQSLVKKTLFVIILIMMIFGFVTAYYGGYYKWEIPLRYQTSFAGNSRLLVYLNPTTKEMTQQLVSYIDLHTDSSDYIFVNYYQPLIYFLSNRNNATPYDFVIPSVTSRIMQENIIHDLVAKRVKLVLVLYSTQEANTLLNAYIRSHFRLDYRIGDHLMYKRKEE